jgi:DNA-binding HxlR family transcriptional regulator
MKPLNPPQGTINLHKKDVLAMFRRPENAIQDKQPFRQLEITPMVQKAIFSLHDPKDFDIMNILAQEGPMTFSDLKKQLSLASIALDRCLTRLMDGALLGNYYAKSEGKKAYSFYEITSLGQDLRVHLMEMSQPMSVMEQIQNPYYRPGPIIAEPKKCMFDSRNNFLRFRRQLSASEADQVL